MKEPSPSNKTTEASQHIFHVSPLGDDLHPGTEKAPFQTLDKARKAVREVNRSMTDDIIVYLHDGAYHLEETWELTPQDSGTNGHWVIYKNAEGAKPIVSGGRKITGWALHDADRGIWAAPVPAGADFRQLYVNGRKRSRTCSDKGLPEGTVRTETGYELPDDGMSKWRNPGDIEFVYRVSWREPRCLIEKIEGTTITMCQPGWGMCNSWGAYGDYFNVKMPAYIENAYELLEHPGEWYLDKSEEKIYYIPCSGEDPQTAEFIAPWFKTLIQIQGEANKPVSHIRFRGLTFAESNWLLCGTGVGYPCVQAMVIGAVPNDVTGGPEYYSRQAPAAILLHGAESIAFHDNTFARLGANGLEMRSYCRDCAITGNEFHEIAGSALRFGDLNKPHPDDPNDVVRNTLIGNNYIHDTGREYRDAPAIVCFYTDGTHFLHNEISQIPYTAISMGWGWGRVEKDKGQTVARNNRIEFNHIHHYMLTMEDGSAVYTLGWQPDYVIRGNWVHDAGVHVSPGLYLDNGARYATVTENVLEDVDCNMMVKGTDHVIVHNFWQTEHFSNNAMPNRWPFLDSDRLNWTMRDNCVVMDSAAMPASITNAAGLEPAFWAMLQHPARVTIGELPPPTGLISPSQTDVTVDLSWQAPESASEITGYEIWMDGGLIAATSQTLWRVTGLKANCARERHEYSFKIAARDRSGNLSDFSGPLNITTRQASGNLALNRPTYGFQNTPGGLPWSPSIHSNCVSMETGHDIWRAVDGDPDSYACPLAIHFAWSYQIDLEAIRTLDSITIRFVDSPLSEVPLFSTHFEIQASNNIEEEIWETFATLENNQSPNPPLINLWQVKARHLRIRSLKPDGPDQDGVRMAIQSIHIRGAEYNAG